MIDAKIILHSYFIDEEYQGDRHDLISIECYAPYFLDAEIEKHGMLASNSSSNRAIPFNTIKDQPFFLPPDMRYNEGGMQGSTVANDYHRDFAHGVLSAIREFTLDGLNLIDDFHKQHLNRYLAPWSMQRKIITGTKSSWQGFLKLRDHFYADPNVQILARLVKEELTKTLDGSYDCQKLGYGEWHLPYIKQEEKEKIKDEYESKTEYILCRISSARCARTSYNYFDGRATTTDEDLDLFVKLADNDPQHATPLTHQGKVVSQSEMIKINGEIEDPDFWPRGVYGVTKKKEIISGEFRNWVQFRHWYNDVR